MIMSDCHLSEEDKLNHKDQTHLLSEIRNRKREPKLSFGDCKE